jgi:hypothetical protein
VSQFIDVDAVELNINGKLQQLSDRNFVPVASSIPRRTAFVL